MTIAITGATGQLGRHVIGKLKQKTGADGIVALVRSLDKAQDCLLYTSDAADE